MTNQRDLDRELLDLLRQTRDVPKGALPPNRWGNSAIPGAETAYETHLREFEQDRADYAEEQRELNQPEDEQEAWRDLMRKVGRLT